MGDSTFLPDASLQSAVLLLVCLGAGALWYEWRLSRLRHQLKRTKVDNQALGERTLQARRQVESLQQDLSTKAPQREDSAVREQRVRAMMASLEESDRRAGIAPDTQSSEFPSSLPPHGFADTQPFLSPSAAALAEARANHGFADTEPMCIRPRLPDPS